MLYFIVFGARNMPRQKPKRKTSSPYARPQSDNDKPKSKDDSVTSASILQPPMDAPSASTADPKPHQDTPSTEGTVEAYQNSDDLKFIDFQPMPILSTNFALGHNVSEKLREKNCQRVLYRHGFIVSKLKYPRRRGENYDCKFKGGACIQSYEH